MIVVLLKQKSPLTVSTENVTVSDTLKRIEDRPDSIGTWEAQVRALSEGKLSANEMIKIYDALFFKKKDGYYNEDNVEAFYSMLEKLSGSFLDIWDEKLIPSIKYPLLYLIVSSQNIQTSIKTIDEDSIHKVELELFDLILDLYIPSDSYDMILNFILPEEDSYILWIMSHSYDTNLLATITQDITDYISDKIGDGEEASYAIRTSVQTTEKLFRYIWDLFSKRESRIDFFSQYHHSLYDRKDLKDAVNNLCKMTPYYPEDLVRYSANEILYLIITYPDYQARIQKYILESFQEYISDKTSYNQLMLFVANAIDVLAPFYSSHGISFTKDDKFTIQNGLIRLIENFKNQKLVVESEEAEEGFSSIAYALEAIGDSNEGKQKRSSNRFKKRNKITNGFIAYKHAQDSVDKQLSNMTQFIKERFTGNVRSEIIEGKEFSLISILKKALSTSAVFSFSKVGALIYLVVSKYMGDKARSSEKKKLLLELEEELSIVEEKIEDARADGNREAKYALMRTKNNLTNAYNRLKFNITADEKSESTAKKLLNKNRDKNIKG